jgi:prephenate dehydrogenase
VPVSEFKRIAVLGPGLLGGSIALAWKEHHGADELSLWARGSDRVTELRNHGFPKATTDLGEAVKEADLVILAVPVGRMAALAEKLLELPLSPGVVVTDVGSVKGLPHRSVGTRLAAAGIRFVGSHPMAGSEQSGFGAARADLLAGAPCILTNDGEVEEAIVTRLLVFWASLGARTVVMSAEEHDCLVARISHVPHALAVVCALVGMETEGAGRLAGGGLRDTSRVAAGDPALWTEILLENGKAILEPLRESAQILQGLADLIEEGNEKALATVLEEAQRRRLKMTEQQS